MVSAIAAKKVLKVPVSFLQTTLPSGLFNKLYDYAFPKYKSLIQFLYASSGRLLYSWSNKERWEMIKRVNRIMPYTLVGIGGLEASYNLAKEVKSKSIPGDFVELGVARGGCAALICGVMTEDGYSGGDERKLWLFDSYEGLPDPTDEDFDSSKSVTGEHVRPLPKGSCLGTLDEVKKLMFSVMDFPEDRINFIQGWFQDTVPVQKSIINEIALLRLDGDWYESTKVCLEGFYDNVSSGGAIIIDDYQSCYGCKRAVDEFLAARSIQVEINLDGRGGCYFMKP